MTWRILSALIVVVAVSHAPSVGQLPSKGLFLHLGYYFTLMRMPTYGLPEWKQIIDCVAEDGGNTVILWTAGGFRSRKFKESWHYNRDHANVRKDFVRELIDHAHRKQVKVLLGFTPFGYDGVNQMSISRPDWRATGPDGKTTSKFGFHSWGYNLCPARAEAQEFMLSYAREMLFDFYPNADGILIESSDYAACHCRDCLSKYYDHEYRFVKAISDDVLASNPDAVIAVYPHYFNGTRVPGLGVMAARLPFDPRYSLFFTPHSAHPDASLIRRAKGAIWSDDSTARRTPREIKEGALRARKEGISGFMPSLEVFTYVPTEAEEGEAYLIGRRRVPYGFTWLKDKDIPYRELPVRVNRIAYREYSRNPDLPESEFKRILGRELYGDPAAQEAVEDILEVQRLLATERTWCQPAPVASPERIRALVERGGLSREKRLEYARSVEVFRSTERKYRERGRAFSEMSRFAGRVAELWNGKNARLLAP